MAVTRMLWRDLESGRTIFYRRFGQRYGQAPRAYRLRAQRSISP